MLNKLITSSPLSLLIFKSSPLIGNLLLYTDSKNDHKSLELLLFVRLDIQFNNLKQK
jgi:hypothetical protein